jgi:glycosyltransferase involved in cell wall biosynthesis
MKVLIATPLYPPDIGGPATYAKILGDELPARNISIKIISYGGVRHLPKGIAHFFYFVKLLRAIPGHDIVFALDPVSVGLPAFLAAQCWRKKFVVRIAGDYAWEQGKQRFGVHEDLDEFVKRPSGEFSLSVKILRFVQSFVARHAEHIIVPSNYLKGIVEAWGISAEKITVVHNAFEELPHFPSREQLRKNFGFSGSVVFSAGRLVPWKGFDVLLDVIVLLRKKIPDVKLCIAGSGPQRLALSHRIASLHLESVVTMLGDVPHHKLMEYISASDCFVLNTGYEGLSHQLLEVLALGTPIVSTNVGGNPELIANGETGILVGYNDLSALLNAIEGVVNDPLRARHMSEQGKKFTAGFTVSRMVEETKDVLQHIIAHS